MHDVASNCVLDFGTRSIVLTGTLQAAVAGGSFGLAAGDLTLSAGKIRSIGPTGIDGGNVTIILSGALVLTGSGPTLDVSGATNGGVLEVDAGSIDVRAGTVAADGNGVGACGGLIILNATQGPLSIETAVHATGDSQCNGGELDLTGQSVEVDAPLNVTGGDGPDGINILATAGDLTIASTASLKANGEQIDIEDGGAGGPITLEADSGSATVLGTINADGGSPDGYAGSLDISADGSVQVGAAISLQGNGADSSGGDFSIEAGGDASFTASVRTNGGSDAQAGDIDVSALGTITVASGKLLQANGGYFGAGSVTLSDASSIVLTGSIEAKGSATGPAGAVELDACYVSIAGSIDSSANGGGEGGTNTLSAGVLGIAAGAHLIATPCTGPTCNLLVVPAGTPSIDPLASLTPAPTVQLDPLLNLCCGNGTIDPGETCDDGNGLACDGCSNTCQVETNPPCPSDGNECTQDCEPRSGCTYKPRTGEACTDDGDVCTTDECNAFAECVHKPRVCDDGIACTIDSCSPGVGCVATPDDARCDDHDTCTNEHCDATSGCIYENEPDGTTCSDGNACTTEDACKGGKCTPQGPPLHCDDANPCTTDTCIPAIGCQYQEDTSLCPCVSGGAPLPAGTRCADGNDCTQGDTCDGAGICQSGPSCPDDGDPCTEEMCLSIGGGRELCIENDDLCTLTCDGVSDGTPCSDHSACTTGVCQGGACVSTAIPCGDGDPCDGADYCLDFLGCRSGAPPLNDPMCSVPAGGLDAFTCYRTKPTRGSARLPAIAGLPVGDRFGSALADVRKDQELCLPVDVNGASPDAPAHADNLSDYLPRLRDAIPSGVPRTAIAVTNQFGTLLLDLKKPDGLAAPSALDPSTQPGPPVPPDPDHFACYKVAPSPGSTRFLPILGVALEDRLGPLTVDLLRPMHLCTPTDVNGEDATAPTHAAQLVCYQVRASLGTARFVKHTSLHVTSELGAEVVDATTIQELCIPSTLGP